MPIFRVGDTQAECLHHSLRFFTYYCAKSFNWRNCHHTNKLFLYSLNWASLVAQMVKNLSTVWETQVRSLGWKDSPEKEMATHYQLILCPITSSISSCWEGDLSSLQLSPLDGWCNGSMAHQRSHLTWINPSLSLHSLPASQVLQMKSDFPCLDQSFQIS